MDIGNRVTIMLSSIQVSHCHEHMEVVSILVHPKFIISKKHFNNISLAADTCTSDIKHQDSNCRITDEMR